MRKFSLLFFVFLLIFSCKKSTDKIEKTTSQTTNEFAIVIHGGAGYQTRESISKETDSLVRAKLSKAIKVGHEILKNGGTSLDAVQKTINILEDSPLFR